MVSEALAYEPETGLLRWRVAKGGRFARPGAIAGTVTKRGYVVVCVKGKLYYAHRLAWFLTYGDWPQHQIDHRDGDPQNNRLANLRAATQSQNNANTGRGCRNTSGYKGVDWHKKCNKWRAQIAVGGKRISLGFFDTPEAAAAVYANYAVRAHGEFARAPKP